MEKSKSELNKVMNIFTISDLQIIVETKVQLLFLSLGLILFKLSTTEICVISNTDEIADLNNGSGTT